MSQEIINAHQRVITFQAEKLMLLETESAQLRQALANAQAEAKSMELQAERSAEVLRAADDLALAAQDAMFPPNS